MRQQFRAAISLWATTVKPQSAQRSLFDDDDTAYPQPVIADYGIASDVAAVAAMVPAGGEIGLATIMSGEEPMRSRLLGISGCICRRESNLYPCKKR